MTWTDIPPWLSQNTLSDEALQERYVVVAERKWAQCVEDRQALEREIADLRAMKRGEVTAETWSALVDELGERYDWLEEAYRVEAQARAFLEDARRALAGYRPRTPRRG